jgi:hypothetical protein
VSKRTSSSPSEGFLISDAWRLGYFDHREAAEFDLMKSNLERFRRFRQHDSSGVANPFYITVVPRTLDLLQCCLAALPEGFNVFLILNGLEQWEREFIEREYPRIPNFHLESGAGSIMYDRVLDLLVEGSDSNFGILDQDCFVLDPTFLADLQFRKGEFAISPFVSVNKQAAILFPRTYFLLLNIAAIKSLRDRHRISFKRCWTIPPHLESQLSSLGLGYGNFPHASLDYFDNFQLIWAMAMHAGMPLGRVQTLDEHGRERIVHIGAGHNYMTAAFRDGMRDNLAVYQQLPQLELEKLRAAAFSYYSHLRLLETSVSEELRERYLPFFAPCGTSQDLLETYRSILNMKRVSQVNTAVDAVRRLRHPANHRA